MQTRTCESEFVFKGRRVILAHDGKAGRQEPWAADRAASTAGKQRAVDAGHSLPPFILSGSQPQGRCYPHLRAFLPIESTLHNPTQTHPKTYLQANSRSGSVSI